MISARRSRIHGRVAELRRRRCALAEFVQRVHGRGDVAVTEIEDLAAIDAEIAIAIGAAAAEEGSRWP